ncbi:MAG: hypothetical protein HYV26_07100 [Candidatus Hydrogenedentes bacterium]|nr:hypothetical protein [Candidatus Hydrogenedentota bacterium]
MSRLSFHEIVEEIQALDCISQLELFDLLGAWTRDARRQEILASEAITNGEIAAGTARSGSFDDLMRELRGED